MVTNQTSSAEPRKQHWTRTRGLIDKFRRAMTKQITVPYIKLDPVPSNKLPFSRGTVHCAAQAVRSLRKAQSKKYLPDAYNTPFTAAIHEAERRLGTMKYENDIARTPQPKADRLTYRSPSKQRRYARRHRQEVVAPLPPPPEVIKVPRQKKEVEAAPSDEARALAFYEALANVLLGEKVPLEIFHRNTGELIVPAYRKITKTLIGKIIKNAAMVELDPSPIRNKLMEIIRAHTPPAAPAKAPVVKVEKKAKKIAVGKKPSGSTK